MISREPGAGSGTADTKALGRVFFGRLFENDVFSSSVAASSSVLWLLAFLAMPGVMFSVSQLFAYAHLAPPAIRGDRPHAAAARGVSHRLRDGRGRPVTMMVWSSLTPDRRDAHVLGPLPITARQQALGRLLALLTFFGLFIAAMAVPTGSRASVRDGRRGEHLRASRRASSATSPAAVLAGAFVFFLLVNAQLMLAALFGPGAIRAVTLPLQLAAMAGMIVGLISSGSITNLLLAHADDAGGGMLWNPAAWFVGIYRWVAGDERPVFAMLAIRGAIAGVGIDRADADHVSARLRAMPAQRDRRRRPAHHGDVARLGIARRAAAAAGAAVAAAARHRGIHARDAGPQPHASIHHRPLRRPRVHAVAAADGSPVAVAADAATTSTAGSRFRSATCSGRCAACACR